MGASAGLSCVHIEKRFFVVGFVLGIQHIASHCIKEQELRQV
jgi:hypothetical protein